ncbi:MAG: 2-amino-4-hydroxy-6-hydroxymethyldihydropteridine diphosphokinase [Chitinivibrionia bacterium]|nr:2-amino-4-hydroxy-6-hydroxymethyldihydropteridine diphosphokinase [Chitinivibrionia bacterium]MCL1946149.1 2-amino-4-hydroxy-6-hydroxymethyldihydropteridine diphosphokinase [Chitinivibrionia bacterium]
MSFAVLCLGTNVGDKLANIKAMRDELQKISKIPLICSPVYESAAVDVKIAQENYFNQTILIETDETPEELLKITQNIEKKLGRKSKNDKSPRTADIDILLFDEIIKKTPALTIPHPRLFFRKFAIEGVKSLNTNLLNPFTGEKFANYRVSKEILRQKIKIIE